LQDHLQHTLGAGQNIVVPEPDDSPAVIFEPSRSPRIVSAVGMLAAVEFNDQTPLDADKIGEKDTNRMLATEFVAAQLPIAHQPPKAVLGIGHVGA